MTSYDFREDRPRWGEVIGTQFRVVAALIRREMRAHFGESRMGYLWALVEPGLHLAVMLAVFIYILHRRPALGTNTAVFILSGIIPYFLYSKIASYLAGSVSGNRQLLTLPPVKLHDVIVARTILEATTYIFVGYLMFLALFMSGVAEAVPYDLLRVLEGFGFAIAIGVGVGMINIVIVSYFHNWMTFFGFLSTPLWFFSGLWYIPDEIPEPYRHYILYNPLVHVIMIVRSGFYREFKATLLDMPYLVGFAGVVLAVGLAMIRTARRRILAPI